MTEIKRKYLDPGKLNVRRMGQNFAWLDSGISQSLMKASEFSAMLER
jgi:glucose-1-phosphate thymidylyltransferase